MSNSEGYGIAKKIVEVIITNEGKNIKWRFRLNNKLIIFTYYLKWFLTLSQTIKLFYQIYLIYLIT